MATLTPNISLSKPDKGEGAWWSTWNGNADLLDALFSDPTRTPGSILFYNSTNKIADDNANLFWDAVNKRLGVGTATPATSAILELASTTGAFLPTRMTTAQRDALTAVDGMMLYNSSTGALNYRKAGVWTAI